MIKLKIVVVRYSNIILESHYDCVYGKKYFVHKSFQIRFSLICTKEVCTNIQTEESRTEFDRYCNHCSQTLSTIKHK